jgi:hypothetical protein
MITFTPLGKVKYSIENGEFGRTQEFVYELLAKDLQALISKLPFESGKYEIMIWKVNEDG